MLAAKRLISAASRSAAIRKVPAMLAVPSVKMTTENVPQNPRKSAPLLHSVVVMVSGPDAQDILPLFSSRVTELNVRFFFYSAESFFMFPHPGIEWDVRWRELFRIMMSNFYDGS